MTQDQIKTFEKSDIFTLMPIYSYVILDYILWIWVLFLMSDKYGQDDNLLFFKP